MSNIASRTLALVAAFVSMLVAMTLKTFADTVFLAEYGVEYVPHFFVAQAIVTIATAALYGQVIKRGASASADLTILIGTAALAFSGPAIANIGGWAVFGLSLGLVALSALAVLAVWNAATAVVTGRQTRAFIPRLGAAATLGAALGGFGSSAVVAALGVIALAPTAGIFVTGLVAVHLVLLNRARSIEKPRKPKSRVTRKPARDRLSRRLITMLIAATVVEAFLSAFIDYGFKREVATTLSRDDMGLFFALFYGGGNIILLFIQLFVSSKLLTSKSLRHSLSLEPFVLVLAALAWAFAPVLALAALGRGIEMIGKFGVARPAQEVALTPMREASRQRWKVLLRGVFNQGGAVAGGLLLIAVTSRFDLDLAVVPACIAALALLWLLLQRRVAASYLDTLGSELGMLGLSVSGARGEFRLDRDGLAQVIDMIGDSSYEMSRFGRELLEVAVEDTALLAPHLSHQSPQVRRALYRILTHTPNGACLSALREAVLQENDDAALTNGFLALGASGDGAAIKKARRLVDESTSRSLVDITDPIAAALMQSAWSYLAKAGALTQDPVAHRAVLDDMMLVDGGAAARLYNRAIRDDRMDGGEIDEAVINVIESPSREHRRQGLRAAAVLGRSKPLVHLLKALEKNASGADEAVGYLDSPSLGRLSMLAGARNASPRLRARLVRALGASELPEAVDMAARYLRDEEPSVRALASHTLLKLTRDSEIEPPRDLIDDALRDELDRFAVYARARPGYGDKRDSSIAFRHDSSAAADVEVFFLDELERRTERALAHVCGVLALQGNPSKIYAAERVLRAPTVRSRRQGVDILQEVARGPHRGRLFDLLELYLDPKADGSHEAREAVCKQDPWLERIRSGEIRELRYRLGGLRSTVLFDIVAGDALANLAEHVDEVTVEAGDVVVQQGEPADALFVVMSGALSVERDGDTLGKLGAGQCFGELALIDGKPRSATVVATKKSRMLRLPRAPFQQALNEHSEIGLGLVRGLAKWLRRETPK